jgi:hypothetical protein
MRRALFLIALMVLALSPVARPAEAQSAPRLATVVIDVWPEFDRANTVLVIYRGEFAAGAPLPAQVTLRIPASAGDPSAVASPDPGQESAPVNEWKDLIAAKKVTTQTSGDWTEVTFSPLNRVFTLEFYDKLNTVTFDRRYTLTWPGDLAVDAVTLNVREPYGATNFQATPALLAGVRDDDGLMAHQVALGALNVNQALQITLSYHREDKRTSVEALQLVTPTPTRQPISVPAPTSPSMWPLIAALVVGLALIVAGVVWYFRSQRKPKFRPYQPPRYSQAKGRRSVRTSRAPRARPRPVAMHIAEDEPEDKVFCTQCGKQLQLEDTFCSRCGARAKGK